MQTMSADMEYNFEAALARQRFADADIHELRSQIKKFSKIPKTLSDRKVRN